MKAITILLVILWIGSGNTAGQPYSLYSDDTLVIESTHLRGTVRLNLHLPETQPFSAGTTKYPITIIFDSQHERTYPLLISSFDLLTSETQIPESIIIGVPFTIQNRLYLTSNQRKPNDSLSGIERMELFLFSELIPLLQDTYKGNEFISLIGHSRTAYLVNYLAFKRPDQVNIAVSLSGFFSEKPLSINSFYSFLTDPGHFPDKFNYYYTAGTTLEESTYLLQFRELDSLLKDKPIPENVKITFHETPNANHVTNFWLSLPPILIDAFSGYNAILDRWFHDKMKSENTDLSVGQFQADLQKASNAIAVDLNPNLTHIYSLASYFAYSKEDYKTAIEFIQLGLDYFPDYLELYIEAIEFCKVLNNIEKANHYKSILQEKATESTHLNKADKDEIMKYLDEN